MHLPSLSVVMPHYNHGRYLRQALAALLAQSLQPLEIIIVDDASSDRSEQVLAEVEAAHPGMRVYHNDRNRGVGYSSNRGLALCRGDYVYMAAADDLVLPGFFARALSLARDHPQAGMVYGRMARTDEAGDVLCVHEVSAWQTARFVTPQQFLREHLEGEDPSHSLCSATIYRREVLQALGGYRTELGHWMDTFVARAIGLRDGACYVPETFVKWRYSRKGYCGSSSWQERVHIVRRAVELMRSEPYCQWFPKSHVAWWERAALRNLFHAQVTGTWPWLERLRSAGGLRARGAHWSIGALTRFYEHIMV